MKKQKNAPQILPREEWPYEVPENWVWTRLKHIIKLVSGQDVSVKLCNNEGKGLPYIMGASNIVGEQFIAERWIENPVVVSHKNDILLSVKGTVGKIYVQKEEELNISRQIMAISPYSCLDSTYCKYDLENIVEGLQAEAVGLIPGISRKNVLEKEIPLPPLPEQQRIVTRIESLFAKLDAAAEKIRVALDQFPTRKAAILHKAFTGELTKKWREENGVGMESWEKSTLEQYSELITKGASPKWQGVEYTEDMTQTLFVTSENVQDGYLDFKKKKFVKNEINLIQKRSVLKYGDVLLNIVGASIGRAAIFNQKCMANTNQAVAIIRPNDKLCNSFLCNYLNSAEAHIYYETSKVETARANINLRNIAEMQLNFPTLPEQQEIVRRLDAILAREQTAKETAERLLDTIALTKKSILARAFRGLLGTNNPKEKSAEGLLRGEPA